VVGIYVDLFVEVLAQELVYDPLDVAAFIRHCVCVQCVAT